MNPPIARPRTFEPYGQTTTAFEPGALVRNCLDELMSNAILLPEDWERVPDLTRRQIVGTTEIPELLENLVKHELLTDYQMGRLLVGKVYGLVLGNYRVLDRLGAGGMGVVYRAEHTTLRRVVAVKVMAWGNEQLESNLSRFFGEMRAVARLRHPNIVQALDAGVVTPVDPDEPKLYYYVMEYVKGQDLEDYVIQKGPLQLTEACDLIYQTASALAEAHQHHLVHRDIKPSNILRTTDNRAKLLDFGLARHLGQPLTEPGTVLGTIDYLAPEQAIDASKVDIRADIYGLGGTLYWTLTGQTPFPPLESMTQEILRRQQQAPPSIRTHAPTLPQELDTIVTRMMARRPDDRYQTPQAVMKALRPLLASDIPTLVLSRVSGDSDLDLAYNRPRADGDGADPTPDQPPAARQPARLLLVDDAAEVRTLCRLALERQGHQCTEAGDGKTALSLLSGMNFDLVLLDLHMPGISGVEVCQTLRRQPRASNLKIIVYSGNVSAEALTAVFDAGADDTIQKPFSLTELNARVRAALRLKEAQDRSDVCQRHLVATNQRLEELLALRDGDLLNARNALVLSLAKMAECRTGGNSAHLRRVQRYCHALVDEAGRMPSFAGQIEPGFSHMLECCVPLYDIGKIALPDHILKKPGRLDPEERFVMQTHTVIGAETLRDVARQHGAGLTFLQMAIDIARHHHERVDGQGYPDRLSGSQIPLSARVVAFADVYDGLRRRQVYKPALSHEVAIHVMIDSGTGQFDPGLLQAFQRCHHEFKKIFEEIVDG